MWTGRALLRVWIIAVAAIVLSQLASAVAYPRRWEFFWILPIAGDGPIAFVRAAGSVWLGLWQQRPWEGFSLTVAALAVGFTLAWLTICLVRAARHASFAKRAV